MIIKKFTGKTEDDAVALAQKELGQDIVIMNVKEVKRGGLFKIFRPTLMEITVALEEENEKAILIRKEQAQEKEAAKAKAEFAQEMAKVQQPVEEIGQKLANLQALLEQQIQSQTQNQNEEEVNAEEVVEESKSREELENLRLMKLLYNTLIENEVSEQNANQIIEGMEKNIKSNASMEYLLSTLYQKTILKFGQPCGIEKAKKNPKVVFFIGPTGVGKTTTIAKIASKVCVEEKSRVALLTTDTYRIAAAEQLRTYANILEVPLRVIYTVDELQKAIVDFSEYDYIFVDTSGHSYKNQEQKDATLGFVNCLGEEIEKEIYLVLSATTKHKDLIMITDAYSGIDGYKLIFTKLDETTAFGNLLNIKLHTGAQMSYITCGQNVPDDIEKFNPQQMVRFLLGGNNT